MAKKSFLNIALPSSLMEAIDEYRFEMRFDSRASAVRFLLEWALKQKPKP